MNKRDSLPAGRARNVRGRRKSVPAKKKLRLAVKVFSSQMPAVDQLKRPAEKPAEKLSISTPAWLPAPVKINRSSKPAPKEKNTTRWTDRLGEKEKVRLLWFGVGLTAMIILVVWFFSIQFLRPIALDVGQKERVSVSPDLAALRDNLQDKMAEIKSALAIIKEEGVRLASSSSAALAPAAKQDPETEKIDILKQHLEEQILASSSLSE
ncbi:hypothetical protein COX69_00890 [Candidatus Falkowbacteria bacterium CG_4_10_14_0_2_um_filter_48_10]|uniref:Uncharacterized protein n=1 Tax=Candidatus Falkowbacteria bacterium CG23_combo_of_CG06-09_8_20_14_all_49_15 TaxID=1974572 RepID=A0A2G9ZLU3_9BACT|nr:MAG: hypothetical protein COX22_03740 [Candidatus Falkowbacteria bacterium CG23_combo_of_CG06-09_8_20_14_all_49_15]PJA08990.1 MAG: hypothetical protein COX69_00890 [Candidatus Falkowbacteria bacterium CG_4_10_14_0_2_um_filter_48_10]